MALLATWVQQFLVIIYYTLQLCCFLLSFAISVCISYHLTKVISRAIFYKLIFISLAHCSTYKSLACNPVRNGVIFLLLLAIFHYDPSFTVLGPNQIVSHETVFKQGVVNSPLGIL